MNTSAILASIKEANSEKNLYRPSWSHAKAILVPTVGQPSLIRMRVSPIVSEHAARLVDEGDEDYLACVADHCDSILQSEMMRMLCDQPRCGAYKRAERIMAMPSISAGDLEGMDTSAPTFFPLLSDSCRLYMDGDDGNSDNDVCITPFFLGKHPYVCVAHPMLCDIFACVKNRLHELSLNLIHTLQVPTTDFRRGPHYSLIYHPTSTSTAK